MFRRRIGTEPVIVHKLSFLCLLKSGFFVIRDYVLKAIVNRKKKGNLHKPLRCTLLKRTQKQQTRGGLQSVLELALYIAAELHASTSGYTPIDWTSLRHRKTLPPEMHFTSIPSPSGSFTTPHVPSREGVGEGEGGEREREMGRRFIRPAWVLGKKSKLRRHVYSHQTEGQDQNKHRIGPNKRNLKENHVERLCLSAPLFQRYY